MPGGDRTGPAGAGPLTGRGAGWCAGNDRPGFANAAPGFGLGWGYRRGGFGGGRGWRNVYYATGLPLWARAGVVPPVPPTDLEVADLKVQASRLAQSLDAIRKRIEELESSGAAPAAS